MNLEIIIERIDNFNRLLSTFNDEFVERLNYATQKINSDGLTEETTILARNLFEEKVAKIERMIKKFNEEILATDFELLGLKEVIIITDLIQKELNNRHVEFKNELTNINKIINSSNS